MTKVEITTEALKRAQDNKSLANYGTIYHGFSQMGIALDQITPRVNVLTFNAWLAKGRRVMKGQHGVKVDTWVPIFKTDQATGEKVKCGQKPKTTTVFHLSQTEAV